MQRAVRPRLDFRCSRWPPQRQIAAEADNLQQKMLSCMLRLPRLDGETPEAYVRRRGRIARRHCHQQGSWSARWFKRAVAWDHHLGRPRNSDTWSAKLRDFRGKAWLQERRALFGGRTATRAIHGKVQMRWHDGIDYAGSTS